MKRLKGKFIEKGQYVTETPEMVTARVGQNLDALDAAIRADATGPGRALAKAVLDAVGDLRSGGYKRAVEIAIQAMGPGVTASQEWIRDKESQAKSEARAKLVKATAALRGALDSVTSEINDYTSYNQPKIDFEKQEQRRAQKLSALDLESKLVRVKHQADFLDKGNIARLLDEGDPRVAFVVLDSTIADAHLKGRALGIVEEHLSDPIVTRWHAVGLMVEQNRAELISSWKNLSTSSEALAASDAALSGKYSV